MTDNHTPLKNNDDPNSPQSAAPFKEAEPTSVNPQEMLKPIEEPEVNPEVIDFIKKTEAAKVPPDLKQLGVQSTDEHRDPSKGPVFNLTDDKIEEGLHQPLTSSWRWLAETLLYHLKQAHITLKKVHGHVTRVLASS